MDFYLFFEILFYKNFFYKLYEPESYIALRHSNPAGLNYFNGDF